MLLELRIEDFAIIDHLELRFDSGLVVFTGETGAGKSIIIDAVGTLLGSRADTTMVRAGAERALIEGTFRIPQAVREEVHRLLAAEDLLDDGEVLYLGREIRPQGRSVARVNGRSVNLSLLRDLGEYLVDVHGQSDHLSLLRVREHLHLIDRFADVGPLLADYREQYRQLQEVRKELSELRAAERDAARRSDLLEYQINEIEAARLNTGEEDELRQEKNRLANAENIASLTQEALMALEEGGAESLSVIDSFGPVVDALISLARTDPSQAPLRDQAEATMEALNDLGRELRAYLEGIEFNPKRLDWVEDRLNLIFNLKRKYGDSIAAVLAFQEEAQRQLDQITNAGERIQELEVRERELLQSLGERGAKLSAARQAAAVDLCSAVEEELEDLRMEQAKFEVSFAMRPDPDGVLLEDGSRVAYEATGLDVIEFLVAPNPGEGLKPLVKIASGGETSRLMLALKNVLARADRTPTLIFDEIDQGIGGRVGSIVGEKLWRLARGHQVLCITHLPQLAAYGEQHCQVQKDLLDGRTVTRVLQLDDQERVRELAQMMGEISEGTLQSAQDILQAVAKAHRTV